MDVAPARDAAHVASVGAAPDLRHNVVVHTIDAGFFGAALGVASFVTVIPLFVASLTGSAAIVGLVAALHPFGWHLPQALAARSVAGRERLLPLVLRRTLHERAPFFLLAVVAARSPHMPPWVALALTLALAFWVGIGGGLTAPAFLSMVPRIVPLSRVGAFYGLKTAAANVGLALGALVAGSLLAAENKSAAFAACFFLAGLATIVSWLFLAWTREPNHSPVGAPVAADPLVASARRVLGGDARFRWYVFLRCLTQFAVMGVPLYAVYATYELGMGVRAIGVATAAFALAQVVGNPVLGGLGDRRGNRFVLLVGLTCAAAAALIASMATSGTAFVLVFTLSGLANVAVWTTPLSMVLTFGEPAERHTYIGLSNSLVAPSIILAPLVGGWLAQSTSYRVTFVAAAIAAVCSLGVVLAGVVDGARPAHAAEARA